MRIDATAAIDHPGRRYPFALEQSAAEFASLGEARFADSICVQGEYWAEQGSVLIQGNIAARLDVRCSRCLEPMQYPIEIDFTGMYAREEDVEECVYGLEGKEMVLDKLILDEVSLAMPAQFLCMEDCKGLCPVCGVNKNHVSCDCDTSSNGLNPFEKLKDLF